MAYATDIQTNHRTGGIFSRVTAMVSALAEARAKSRMYHSTRRELLGLNQRELDDLGIAPGDINAIARQAAYGVN